MTYSRSPIETVDEEVYLENYRIVQKIFYYLTKSK